MLRLPQTIPQHGRRANPQVVADGVIVQQDVGRAGDISRHHSTCLQHASDNEQPHGEAASPLRLAVQITAGQPGGTGPAQTQAPGAINSAPASPTVVTGATAAARLLCTRSRCGGAHTNYDKACNP